VIGWAFNSVSLYDYSQGKAVQAYAYGLWPPNDMPELPGLGTFCTSADDCNAGVLDPSSATGPDACQLTGSYQDHCWWRWPVAWSNNCAGCGVQALTYNAGAADPGPEPIAPYFQQQCSLPANMSNAVVVGASDPAVLGCPGKNWTSAGPIQWTFGAAANGTNPSKILFDQVGAGFGGHFWFGYSIKSDQVDFTSTTPTSADADDKITGTWPVPSSVAGWTNVMVHIPSYGAWDPQAVYEVNAGGGQAVVSQIVDQAQQANTWVSLGVYNLGAGANVSLSNVTYDGLGWDVAWNALALVPSSAPGPDYVAMGDSYSSGEGLPPFEPDSDVNYDGMVDYCHRSASQAYPRQVIAPGNTAPIATLAQTPSGGTQFHFTACSGAMSPQMTEAALDTSAGGQVDQTSPTINTGWVNAGNIQWFHELPQTDDGWLSPQTTLVTLTMGGDDARFVDVLMGCIDGINCIGSDWYLNASYVNGGNARLDPESLVQYEPEVISALGAHLAQVYQTIAAEAPNAEIIVLGYPRLFPDASENIPHCTVSASLPATISSGVTNWLNQMRDQLGSVESAQVATLRQKGINIHYIDPNNPGDGTDGFGDHTVCDSSGAVNPDSWINPVISLTDPADLHPKAAGQAEYAKLVNECLRGQDNC
jgi:hypothetical protein